MYKKAFTLVELMIVVAIIGILAAIAIPNFVEMQYRAKRAEVPANVDGIKTAEMGYDAAFNTYISAGANPAAPSGKAPQPWTPTTPFQQLGWSPDGEVRGSYSVATIPASGNRPGGDFEVTGLADIDGDGLNSEYTATKSVNAIQVSANDTY